MRFGFGRRRDPIGRGPTLGERFESGGTLYKILTTVSIVGIFIAAGILVLAATQVFKLSAGLFGTVAMIGILCLALVSMLPWVRRFERNENKPVAIAFMSVISACAVLWIVSDWLIVAMVTSGVGGVALLWFVKIAIILSLQLMVADVVAVMVLRFGKTYLPFQIITYLSYAFIDFYVTFLLCCIHINGGDIQVGPAFGVFGSKAMIALISLAVVFAAISSSILRFIQTRRLRNMINDYSEGRLSGQAPQEGAKEEEPKETPEEKLEKLKKLYEQELISKEDYEAKKAEIVKDL